MTAEEIRRLIPMFSSSPFTIHVKGKTFQISHPEFASMSPNGKTLIVWDKDGPTFNILDVDLIARVEVYSAPGRQ